LIYSEVGLGLQNNGMDGLDTLDWLGLDWIMDLLVTFWLLVFNYYYFYRVWIRSEWYWVGLGYGLFRFGSHR
jgi:hypothetical protein